jgi:hypothetical protein
MTETLMPGGGVARRPLHFIVMADCSGSMKGEKMQALNYALRSMLPHLVDWERDQLQAQLLIRILAFASAPNWYVADPVPVAELSARWRNLEYVPMGRTNMGPAFRAVAEALSPDRLERRALRPAILLITDGLPTDPPGGFEQGLAELLSRSGGTRVQSRLTGSAARTFLCSWPTARTRSPTGWSPPRSRCPGCRRSGLIAKRSPSNCSSQAAGAAQIQPRSLTGALSGSTTPSCDLR